MRLRLEDQGEGWFWETPELEAEVLTYQRVHSREFYRVAFAEPLLPDEAGPPTPDDAPPAAFCGAWLSPRWVGHEIHRDPPVAALVWLLDAEHLAGEPDSDLPWAARVAVREVAG